MVHVASSYLLPFLLTLVEEASGNLDIILSIRMYVSFLKLRSLNMTVHIICLGDKSKKPT